MNAKALAHVWLSALRWHAVDDLPVVCLDLRWFEIRICVLLGTCEPRMW